jgi:hypothetical protein
MRLERMADAVLSEHIQVTLAKLSDAELDALHAVLDARVEGHPPPIGTELNSRAVQNYVQAAAEQGRRDAERRAVMSDAELSAEIDGLRAKLGTYCP